MLRQLNDKSSKITNVIMVTAVIIIIFTVAIKSLFIANFATSGASMAPTYIDRQIVWVNKLAKFSRGDIVVAYKAESEIYIIKRIVGLSGDRINAVRDVDGSYYLTITTPDGQTFREKYIKAIIPNILKENLDLLENEYVVSEGCVFLIGDNRNNSLDSRVNGEYSQDCIVGVVFAPRANSTKIIAY
ncbi:MAG: signal peptidase I [Clostridia bacterium]